MVAVGSPGVTRPGEVRRVEGEGMPVFESTARGDLYVTFSVAFPKEVTPEQAKQLRALFGEAQWHDPSEL